MEQKTLKNSLREKYKLENKLIFGSIQPADEEHFSPIILHSYKENMDENTAFVLLGGHENYVNFAKELNLKNCFIFPFTNSEVEIDTFLESVDIYAHGSPRGNQLLPVLHKVLKNGIPIVSHFGSEENVELLNTIGDAGVVHGDPKSYCFEFWNLKTHDLYRKWRGTKALQQYQNLFGKKITENNTWMDEWLDEDK
jgi:hypothetical protein